MMQSESLFHDSRLNLWNHWSEEMLSGISNSIQSLCALTPVEHGVQWSNMTSSSVELLYMKPVFVFCKSVYVCERNVCSSPV